MNVELPATIRLSLPKASNYNLQNLYIFNMYRSASSLTEAIAQALASVSGRVGYPLMNTLADLGVSIVDPQTFARNTMFIAKDGEDLVKLCNFGGYVMFGFREVPIGFARRFTHVGAAVIAVRDPRDIGISQYYAVKNHIALDNPVGDHIRDLRNTTESEGLDEFLLSDETINFLTRISMAYAPLVRKGVQVIRYEESTEDGEHFSQNIFMSRFWYRFENYVDKSFKYSDFKDAVDARIEKSDQLKGHATSGRINTYRDLPRDTLRTYTRALAQPLRILGYL